MIDSGISIVLPVFNGERFLADTLNSIALQTLRPRELIIVDDGSSDGSADHVADFHPSFPVRTLHQENAGQSAARNRGIREASGGLIALIDQDDLWHEEHLAALSAPFAGSAHLGWVYSDFDEIDQQGNLVCRCFIREHKLPHPKSSLAGMVGSDIMALPSASLLRRDALNDVGGFDEELQGFEDDDLFVRMFRAGWHHHFVPVGTVAYRVHPLGSGAQESFHRSRLRYAGKLATAVPDDARLNRFYVRDLVAPRFFDACLDDYVRAVSLRDWERAAMARDGLNHFARLRRGSALFRLKLSLAQSPALFRLLLRITEFVPRLRGPDRRQVLLRLRG